MNCIFCQIVAGKTKGKVIYQDDLMMGILDINPCTRGHVLILPREHQPVLPLVPEHITKHLFSKMPAMVGAIKSAMIATGCILMIANGAIAGQQSPHFMLQIFPRENGDDLNKYSMGAGQIDEQKKEQAENLLANNIPIMMRRYFEQNPMEWHNGNINIPDYIKEIPGKPIYQDEKIVGLLPKDPVCPGHMVFYSNEETDFENLSEESGVHMLQAAKTGAVAVFEGLGAQGSNIILKTGISEDNPDGRMSLHVLPRFPDDGLDLLCKPMKNKPNLDQISEKIRDKTFIIEHSDDKVPEPEVIDLDKQKIKVIEKSPDEVTAAIQKLRK